METSLKKFGKLVHDLREARLQAERQRYQGTYLGIGACIRVATDTGERRIGVYGSDIPNGLVITFVENGRIIPNTHIEYIRSGQDDIIVHYTSETQELSIKTLQQSHEFKRVRRARIRPAQPNTPVHREEIVVLDNALRHAICQATAHNAHTQITAPIGGIRLPIREFNKRLPNHSNAFKLWLKFHDTTLPPERQLLVSGLPYSTHHVAGGDYEGGVTVAVAGRLRDFANSTAYPRGPLLRMHSACCFSEQGRRKGYIARLEQDTAYTMLRDSLRYAFTPYRTVPSESCDCRLQMEESQRLIATNGGIFADFYEQEGRGYGLLNKEEFFYRLHEEENLNTAEVCQKYGINPDIRVYDRFIFWLQSLNIQRVQLIGNNPRKRQALEAAGIEVTSINLWLPTKENIHYLQTKRDMLGHEFPSDQTLLQKLRPSSS